MSPCELAKACADRLNTGSELATRIQLVIPAEPRGERIRLDRTSRRKCPMGEDEERICSKCGLRKTRKDF